MIKKKMKKSKMYTIDLLKVEGDGKFPCPKCGVVISPDDESEEVYTIIETKVKDDQLEKLVLECNACRTKINLVGFLAKLEA
jgi:predicted RNA-binding Zn-ribbon protein involved in translation (DUF1610 family)